MMVKIVSEFPIFFVKFPFSNQKFTKETTTIVVPTFSIFPYFTCKDKNVIVKILYS